MEKVTGRDSLYVPQAGEGGSPVEYSVVKVEWMLCQCGCFEVEAEDA